MDSITLTHALQDSVSLKSQVLNAELNTLTKIILQYQIRFQIIMTRIRPLRNETLRNNNWIQNWNNGQSYST
jgi:hypothetical protein